MTGRERGADLFDPGLYLNREVSWLHFNDRVLALARDPSVPLLERLRFLSIYSTNLDEFFMVRVSGLREQVEAGITTRGSDGMTAAETLEAIAKQLAPSMDAQIRCYQDELVPALAAAGVHLAGMDGLDRDQRRQLDEYFERQVFPVLTPLAVDPSHPFPYISNLSLSLAVLVGDPDSERELFARVKVPPILPRFVPVGGSGAFVPLEQLVTAHLDRLFPGMDVLEAYPFRVTRDADIEVAEDEADDLLVALQQELRRRRFGNVVRLEVDTTMPARVVELLKRELGVDDAAVVPVEGPLNLGDLAGLVDAVGRPDLLYEPWPGITPPRLAGIDREDVDVFAVLQAGNLLVHHPYDAFATSVQAFIEAAADDPRVLAIKQTLYRTDGDSPIVSALIRAAEAGKQVVVLVELKARFDEESNIGWAHILERAGCHVTYGLTGLKTHAKTALVLRREADGIRRYCHIGTGNYNAKTARLYTDLGLLTCDEELGADLTDLFNSLTGYSRESNSRRLLVAPSGLREQVIERIEREARLHAEGRPGRIFMQMNSLVDAPCIRALYAASRAGVEIDLVVRGICRLRPGVPGVSEHVRVRSIVGRFLEHQRIMRFENGGEPEYFLGSADLMPRNLDRRVEAVAPVTRPALIARLDEIIALLLADNVQAWELGADGSWQPARRVKGARRVATHEALLARALRRSEGKLSLARRGS
ncbi:MAG TPA: RNA degradosome polyphosphate kinase [Actinomycetes bacterium]|nr:RNA degradosome polyphosphate kinase [Actinomycetes bacterium]